jgi:hypothetical protein
MNKNDLFLSFIVCEISFIFQTLFITVGQLVPKLVVS